MAPKVTLIPNSKMNIDNKFQVFILKNGGGGYFNPPPKQNKLVKGWRGIGLSKKTTE